MAFRCQQNLFQYFMDNPHLTPTLNKTSPPTIIPRLQEQQVPVSPGKSSLSPVSSPSLSSVRAASGMTHFSEAFCGHGSGDDNQPLDLSIHKDKPTWNSSLVAEHKPLCLVKSCTCPTSSPQSQQLPPHSSTEQAVTRSPDPGLTKSSFSPTQQQQVSSSAYSTCPSSAAVFPSSAAAFPSSAAVFPSSAAAFPSSAAVFPSSAAAFPSSAAVFPSSAAAFPSPTPQPLPWAASERSSFQPLPTSDKFLIGSHSSLFRPYPIDQDKNRNLRELQQQLLMHHSAGSDDDDDDGDESTLMDLDSSSTMPSSDGSERSGSSNSNKYVHPNLPQTFAEVAMEACHSPQQTLPRAVKRSKTITTTDGKLAVCFVGGVISHTSLDRSQNLHMSPMSISPSSDTNHRGLQQNQNYSSHSLSPLNSEALPSHLNGAVITGPSGAHPTAPSGAHPTAPSGALPTGPSGALPASTSYHRIQQSTPPVIQHSSSLGTPFSPNPTDELVYPTPQSASTICQQEQPGSESPLTACKPSGNEKNILKSSSSASNSFDLPALTRTFTSSKKVAGGRHGVTEEPMDATGKQHDESTENKNSTKISLLDFWISKILMERSYESPAARKPCNVDYICTANGEKKIRLRLVDLMELQVEQSLKA